MRRSRQLSSGLLLFAVLLLPALAGAEKSNPVPLEAPSSSVKASLLANFAKYTTWPEGTFSTPETPLIIGVLGSEALIEIIDQTAQKTHGSRRIVVRAISTVDEAIQCHLVYITEEERKNEAAWFTALRGKPIVTVGESGQTIRRGGQLEFAIEKDRLKFDASWPAMEAAGVKFKSDMLKFARNVFRSVEPSP